MNVVDEESLRNRRGHQERRIEKRDVLEGSNEIRQTRKGICPRLDLSSVLLVAAAVRGVSDASQCGLLIQPGPSGWRTEGFLAAKPV